KNLRNPWSDFLGQGPEIAPQLNVRRSTFLAFEFAHYRNSRRFDFRELLFRLFEALALGAKPWENVGAIVFRKSRSFCLAAPGGTGLQNLQHIIRGGSVLRLFLRGINWFPGLPESVLPNDLQRKSGFPLGLLAGGFGRSGLEQLLESRNFRLEWLAVLLLLIREDLQHRRFIVTVRVFGIIENGKKAEIFLLRNWVVLMVVT